MKSQVAKHGLIPFPAWESLTKMQRLTAGLFYLKENDYHMILRAMGGDLATADVIGDKLVDYIEAKQRPILSEKEVRGVMGRNLSFMMDVRLLLAFQLMNSARVNFFKQKIFRLCRKHMPEYEAKLAKSPMFQGVASTPDLL